MQKQVFEYTVGKVYAFDEDCVAAKAKLQSGQVGIFADAFDAALKSDSFTGEMLPEISIRKNLNSRDQEWEVTLHILTRDGVDSTIQHATKIMEDTKKGMEAILKTQKRK